MAKSKCIFENIRREIGARNVAQKELAALIGISEKSMSQKLMGAVEFKLSEMRTLAAFFGKSLDYLFGE